MPKKDDLDLLCLQHSLELKNLGFNEICDHYWYGGNTPKRFKSSNIERQRNSTGNTYTAPTYSQALTFFEIKYNLKPEGDYNKRKSISDLITKARKIEGYE